MGRYDSLIGKRVEAEYRTGDIYLTAVGTLSSDDGKSIILEDRFSSGGKDKTMRVEIPYQYVLRIAEAQPKPAPPAPSSKKQHT
jgi:hypothetical protein